INDPSSGFDAKNGDWPEADADWQQWDNSMGANGNALTQQQRNELVPCAAHLGAAIGDAERSHLIQISQPNNPPAQADAQKLLAKARSEFAQCNLADALNGSNGNPASGTASPGSPGNPLKGGVSTGPDDTPTTNTPGASGGTPAGSNGGAPTDPGLTPSPETPGALPLPANVRQQLLNTAAQLDKVLDDAQNYSLAATDRFFKCLGEGISAD